MPDLRDLRAAAAYELGELMDGFRRGADAATLRAQYRDVARHLHTVAVACLLVDGDPQKLFLNLVRCAENGRRFLALLRERALELPPASWDLPLQAALAAGDLERAGAVARLSRDTRDAAASEYEDEFLWAAVLQGLARGAPAAEVRPTLARLLEVAPDRRAARAAVVDALLERDATRFAEAFTAAHAEHSAEVEERARSLTTPSWFTPHRFLWLEGLALLRLAERAGVGLDAELPHCPRLARVKMTAGYDGDWAIPTGAA
jgi:hypothetical protein